MRERSLKDNPQSRLRCRFIHEREYGVYADVYVKARIAAGEDAKGCRDEGSCVLGAGVAIDVVPKGCRIPRRVIVVGAPFQGNVGSEKACVRAVEILRTSGLDAYWYDGILD